MDNSLEAVVVAVRVKPLDDESKENGCNVVQQLSDEEKILLVAGKAFAFDHIFTEESGQADVYEEAVKPAVEKLFAGFNCAVIAYGHTGTGKTYTIGTDPKKCEGECAGIISRAVEEVTSAKDVDDCVEISFMEIYNEEVYDLLTSQPSKLQVQAFNVQSLSRVKVATVEEAIHHLEFGSSNRHTRATKLNAQSSRSHAIFSIYYHQKIGGDQIMVSKLDLVDLAGSEGVRHTGSKGEALMEGNKINHGLLNLRNVISILSTNSKDYVPYRTSTLTTVLKDSLSRESYVTMIACISPSSLDVGPTIMTLRFTEEAKKVMSKPKMNQIVKKFKNANPHVFEGFASIASLIPPTPAAVNKYKLNYTPVSCRKPMAALNNLGSGYSSSADLQDSVFKSRMNTILETQSNSSMLSSSSESTLSRWDTSEMASVLSPLLRKHMKKFQDQLQETLNSTILMSQQRLRAPGAGEQKYTGSPTFEHESEIRKILSVTECTERTIRNELKSLRKELKSYVEEEVQRIHQTDTTSRENAGANIPRKKLRQNLSFTNADNTFEDNNNGSSSNGESVFIPVKRLTRSSALFNRSLKRMTSPNIMSPEEYSDGDSKSFCALSTVKRRSYGRNQLEDSTYTPANLTAVRRSKRLSARNISQNSTYTPTNLTAVRRSKRLSARNISQGDNVSLLNISTATTVKRNRRVRNLSRDNELDISKTCTNSKTGKNYIFSPSRTSTVRRSVRLSARPRKVYKDQTSPLPHLHRIQKKPFKPMLAVSPSDLEAQSNLGKKVLRLLNGTLKELTELVTVGPKTALVIYNFRLLSDRKFKDVEDLKNIPGLPRTFLERFKKANNIF